MMSCTSCEFKYDCIFLLCRFIFINFSTVTVMDITYEGTDIIVLYVYSVITNHVLLCVMQIYLPSNFSSLSSSSSSQIVIANNFLAMYRVHIQTEYTWYTTATYQYWYRLIWNDFSNYFIFPE